MAEPALHRRASRAPSCSPRVLPFLESLPRVARSSRAEGLVALLELLRERSHTLAEMAAQARWLLVDDDAVEPEPKAVKKHWKASSRPLLEALARTPWSSCPTGTRVAIEAAFEAVRAGAGDVGMGKLAQPVRIAITGSSASPGIFETLAVMPQERAVARIERAIGMLPSPSMNS